MKIAVIAKDGRDFQYFLLEIQANKQATEIFKHVRSINDIVGNNFDAVIITSHAWENRQNDGLQQEVMKRINYTKQ